MDKINDKKTKDEHPQFGRDAENVVDIAIARMKTGAVTKKKRKYNFKFIAFVALAIAALVGFSQLDFIYKTPSSETAANGDIIITLNQGQSGHYFTSGKINGEKVKLLVDTGASVVSIPMNLAKSLDLKLGRKVQTKTANGDGTAYTTFIKTMQLGDITLENIAAIVTDGLTGEEALLGMSFLERTKIEQENGVMRIIY